MLNHETHTLRCLNTTRRVWLFVTPWTVAHQAPLSMEFSRQEYWSGLPFIPFSRRSSWPRIEPGSPALQADSLPSEPQEHDKGLKEHSVQRELSMRVADITWVVREENSLRKWRSSLPTREWTSQVVLMVKNLPANAGDVREAGLSPGKMPWSGAWQPTPMFLLRESVDREALQPMAYKIADGHSWIDLAGTKSLSLLHCRQILYQLSHKGSPSRHTEKLKSCCCRGAAGKNSQGLHCLAQELEEY